MYTARALGSEEDSSPIIEIDSQSKELRWLLDQITKPSPPKIKHWSQAASILKLGKRYQFDTLPRILGHSIEAYTKSDPVCIFAFASQHDFELLAKAAMADFGDFWESVTSDELEGIVIGVSAKYIPALVRAMRASEDKKGVIQWPLAARAFKIVRWEKCSDTP